jgi:HAD superfamily hydrolase (TIGR01509 family)
VIKPKALLLDLDGTLLESEKLWFIAEQRLMGRYGHSWTVQDQRHCIGGPLSRVADYMELHINGAQSASIIGAELLREVGSLFASEPIEWRPGAQALVMQAHKLQIPTVIVTASWRVLLDSVMARMSETVGDFTLSVAGDEVRKSKPHPEPYLNAAAGVGVPIDQCLAIEDSHTGTLSAVNAGAKVIAVAHMQPVEMPGAVFLKTLEGQDVESLWMLANM